MWLSGNIWTFWLDLHGPGSYPAWIDRIAFVQYGLAVLGYLAFPSKASEREMRVRMALDVALTVVAGFTIAFFFGLVGLLRSYQIADALVESALEWALFVIAAVGSVRKRDPIARTVMGLLLGANCLYLLGSYSLSRVPGYMVGHPIDSFWFGAWVLRFSAARVAWFRYRAPSAEDSAAKARSLGSRGALSSYLLVAAAFALLVSRVLSGETEYLGLLAFSAAAMAGLLVARQLVELRENERLFAAQLAQEARFRSLVQHSSDVVLVVDPASSVSYVSPSADRVFGSDGPVRVGARLADLLRPEDLAVLEQLLREGASVPRLTAARMQAAAGAWREVEILASDLRDDPAVGGVVLTCRDVTDRNELERQLRHAQKLDAVGQLAGGLAHDFNNVLAVIRGFTDLLREDLPAGSTAAGDVGQIQEAVDRAAAVTKKLLSLSRRQSVQRAAVDLNGLLRGLEPILRQLVTNRVQVRLECADGLWPVLADHGQIEQVVINLAGNARDAMPLGGPVRIITANRTIPPGGDEQLAPGDYVALLIADQGIGMTPEVQVRIFEPFFSTKPAELGMGLGLAMVRRIIGESGGSIAVKSEPGAGATFTVLLPRSGVEAAEAAVPPPRLEPHTDGRIVLVVDDEPSIRTAARRILARNGYQVLEAAGGGTAIEMISRPDLAIDLVLTDLVMPDVHGRDVVQHIARVRPGLPVVCFTGFAGGSDRLDEPALLVAAVVAKPFTADALLRAVHAALLTANRE